MVATIVLLILWVGFAGSHLMLSGMRVRGVLVERLGDSTFRLFYSLLALAFFVPLVWTYFTNKHAGPWVWALHRSAWMHGAISVGMALAFVLLVAGVARPSPASIAPGSPTPSGAQRITRHPVFMAFALFGLLHLLPNGSTADAVFFGGFIVFSLVGGWHQDQRKLASGDPDFRAFHAATPFLPFTGNATLQGIKELHPAVVAAGLLLTVLVWYFHTAWFGG